MAGEDSTDSSDRETARDSLRGKKIRGQSGSVVDFADVGDGDYEEQPNYRAVRMPPSRRNPSRPHKPNTEPSERKASKKSVPMAKKHKGPKPTSVSYSKKTMNKTKFVELRLIDPYTVERDDCDSRFWNHMQEQVYHEVLCAKSQKVFEQKQVDIAHIRAYPEQFEGVIEKLTEFNMLPLIYVRQDYNVDLVLQFFATVHFVEDNARTLVFMAGNQLRRAPFHLFAELCGYKYNGEDDDYGFRIHDGLLMPKNKLKKLCKPNGQIGHVTDLLPFYKMMHKVYRQSIAPKAGETHEVRGFLINLMYATRKHKGRIDVMDYVYNELIHIVQQRRTAAYGPNVHAFVCRACASDVPPFETTLGPLMRHSMIRFQVKKGKNDVISEGESEDASESAHDVPSRHLATQRASGPKTLPEDGILASESAHDVPSRHLATQGASGSKTLPKDGIMRVLKSILCMTYSMHHRLYKDHVKTKVYFKQMNAERRANGEVIPAGSEENISSEGTFDDPYGWLSEVSSQPSAPRPPPAPEA